MADWKTRIRPFKFCAELSVGRGFAVQFRRLEGTVITASGTHNKTGNDGEAAKVCLSAAMTFHPMARLLTIH